MSNQLKFGLVFTLVYPLVPYLSPVIAIVSSVSGNHYLLKQVGNLNALMVLVNIPSTIALSYYYDDDPQFIMLLFLMIWVKVAMSAISAKVC